ncbi:LppX_LprAFG lipoprotein [Kineococcus aurantiacus]|uniref:LppX_LprAFG lipoprotein n=1 Tax=Kineococcus aurantiacus TaxID=37633 RepID=A0A7Y9DHQ8_9ACTN|nr:LppX_LprAFG lipoprotein [Kineococcus aurantiacus]NYD20620.1 hypothetical protein [Kineococcus aurantiacus]
MTTMTRPTTRRRRRLGTLAASGAVVLALGLGACGGGDDAASPSSAATASPATELTAFEAVKASAKTSQEAGSARFSLTASGTGEAAQVGGLSADGSFDATTGAFEMAVALPAAAGGSQVTLRFVDDVAYLSGAPLTAQGQWVRMPLDQLGSAGLDTSAIDPSKSLEQLQGVAQDVRELPAQDIRGVRATGYAGTIDAQQALAQLPADQQTEEAKQAAAQLGTIPFELYVDDQDRPVRLSETITVEASTMTVQTDFFDWGTDVDVAAPDPASVKDLPDTGSLPDAPATPAPAGA